MKIQDVDIDGDKLILLLLYLNRFSSEDFNFHFIGADRHYVIERLLKFERGLELDNFTFSASQQLMQYWGTRKKEDTKKILSLKSMYDFKFIIASLVLANHPFLQERIKRLRVDLGYVDKCEPKTAKDYYYMTKNKPVKDKLNELFQVLINVNRERWESPIEGWIVTGKFLLPYVSYTNDVCVKEAISKREVAKPKKKKSLMELTSMFDDESFKKIQDMQERGKYPSLLIKAQLKKEELIDLIEIHWDDIEKQMKNTLSDFADVLPRPDDMQEFLIKHYIWQSKKIYKMNYKDIVQDIEKGLFFSKIAQEFSSRKKLENLYKRIFPDHFESMDLTYKTRRLQNIVYYIDSQYYKRVECLPNK